jgi:hypothetical protein
MENSVASSAIHRTDREPVGLRRREHLMSGQLPMLAPPIGGDRADRNQGARSMPCVTMPMAPAVRASLYNLVIPRNGLQLPRQLSFDTWLEVGRRLSTVVTSSAWCLGDWLIYGEISFTGRYREAIERTSLDYQTLRNYAWVARKIPFSRRWEKLSFGHHAEVAALPEPEQDYWLRKAHELGWSRNQIRHEIRESLRERSADMEAPETGALPGAGKHEAAGPREPAAPPELTIQMKVTLDQLDLFRQAADQDGYSIEDWALLILDHAAHGSLPVHDSSEEQCV